MTNTTETNAVNGGELTNETPEVQELRQEIAALETRRDEIAQEIEAAKWREKHARAAVIDRPTPDARHDLREATLEAESLQTVAAEITRRRDHLGRQLKHAREEAEREAVEREIMARSERLLSGLQDDDLFAQAGCIHDLEEIAARIDERSAELQSLQNFAAKNGVNSYDFAAFAQVKSLSAVGLFFRAVEAFTGESGLKTEVREMLERKRSILARTRQNDEAAQQRKEQEDFAAQFRATQEDSERQQLAADFARWKAGARDSAAQRAALQWEREQYANAVDPTTQRNAAFAKGRTVDQLPYIKEPGAIAS